MPQISLYIDEETLKKVEKAARLDNTSISKWVSKKLSESLFKSWPANYSNLFGSIDDPSFNEKEIRDFTKDITREEL